MSAAILASVVANDDGRIFGPAERLSFHVVVECTAPSATRLNLLVPIPQSDEATVIDVAAHPLDRIRPETWTSFDGVNRWWICRRNLTAAKSFAFEYSAVVSARPIRIDFARPPLAPLGAATLSARESRQWQSLTRHTGKNWAELGSLAREVAAKSSVPATARAAYDAVIERLDYDANAQFAGGEAAWRRGRGQCCDYAAAFVALCRANAIPARTAAGFYFREDRWQLHVWAEFHVEGYGWVPCDPSLGDQGKSAADRFFAATDGRRFVVTRDLDLSIDLGPGTDAALVQEYLFGYRGRAKPEIAFRVSGGRLPAANAAEVPTP